jgi:hypothetical protein
MYIRIGEVQIILDVLYEGQIISRIQSQEVYVNL